MKDSKTIIEEYVENKDWRVKENSSSPFSYGSMGRYALGEVYKDYWLKEVYPENISKAYVDGYVHIHDLSGLTIYCVGYSLREILLKGVKGVSVVPVSSPAKHFFSALNQIANLTTIFQNEIMGAVAFNSFDTLLAPFIKNDKLSYKEVEQFMQNFIFSINSNSRSGAEPAFSNITFDLLPPKDLADEFAIIGGEMADFTYGECQKEMDMLNKAFFTTMIKGDSSGKIFAYPIPTYNITKNFDWDNENYDLLWQMTGKYGTPYFSNYINSDMNISDARALCCRLKLDLRELRKRNGGLFGSGDSTGCYDEETEILTQNRGWILFKYLTKDDVVLTRNKDGIVELYNPTQIFKYEYNDTLIELKNNKVDLLVTPNHNIVYTDKHNKEQKFIRADEYSRTKHPIPRKAIYKNDEKQYFVLPSIRCEFISGNHNSKRESIFEDKNIPMDLWLEFMGWYLSEGSVDNDNIAKSHGYRVYITQTKSNNKTEICNMLDNLKFNYSYDGASFIICSKQLWSYCKQFKNCYNVFIPREILNECSSRQLNILMDTLMKGDGSINKNGGQKTYYTTSKKLSDDFQELCIKCGYYSNIRIRKPRDCSIYGRFYPKETNSKIYELTICRDICSYVAPKDISKKQYNGYVYCCEVPNHTIMVRRGGKAIWCGNSIGVVTLNLPRMAYESRTEDNLFKLLDKYLVIAKDSLEIKREWLQKNIIDTNMIPAYMEYVGTLNNHFSTIGIIGMNEMCVNLLGVNILDSKGKELCLKVGDYIRNKLLEFQEETGHLYNYEATPSEGTCYRFALKDKKVHPDIFTQGSGKDCYYTNSCHIPVKLITSIDDTFKHQEDLQTQFTGGTVIHIYLEGGITGEQAKSIIKSTCSNYKVPYVSISPISRQCEEHGYIKENVDICPICGKTLKKYQRVTGYIRCVDNFNRGKKAEFEDRKQL